MQTVRAVLFAVFGFVIGAAWGTGPAAQVHAASGTVTTHPAFDTAFTQAGNSIASYLNGGTCNSYGQASNCASLPTCTVIPIGTLTGNGRALFSPCSLYAASGAGELQWAQDRISEAEVVVWNAWNAATRQVSWCQAWTAATPSQQATANSDANIPAGVSPPCP